MGSHREKTNENSESDRTRWESCTFSCPSSIRRRHGTDPSSPRPMSDRNRLSSPTRRRNESTGVQYQSPGLCSYSHQKLRGRETYMSLFGSDSPPTRTRRQNSESLTVQISNLPGPSSSERGGWGSTVVLGDRRVRRKVKHKETESVLGTGTGVKGTVPETTHLVLHFTKKEEKKDLQLLGKRTSE